MGKLFGHTKKANFYAYSTEALRKITNQHDDVFSTKDFVLAFNNIRQWRDPGFDPNGDLQNTAANDSLRTLVKIGKAKRKQKGIYYLVNTDDKSQQFNKVYPDIKDPNRRKRMKKTKEGSNLTKLGSQKTEYQLEEPSVDILETFENKYPNRRYNIEFIFPEMTSLCPRTGQPDFATIIINYVPNKLCIESKSLKLYFFAYRSFGAFMETTTNKILDDLVSVCDPIWMEVRGEFNARGGTVINVTAEYED